MQLSDRVPSKQSQARSLYCLGPSEWPVIRSHQQISYAPTQSETLRVGDLIVYKTHLGKVCHRIINIREKMDETEFLVKGDALFLPDGWINPRDILGKVIAIDQESIETLRFQLLSKFFWFHSLMQVQTSKFLSEKGRFALQRFPHMRSSLIHTANLVTSPWLLANSHWLREWTNELSLAVRSKTREVAPSVRQGILHTRARLVHKVNEVRRDTGQLVFNHFIVPPRSPSFRLVPHGGDYGHGFFYEEIFCRGSTDVDDIAKRLIQKAPVLDLGGGAGRLAKRLALAGIKVTLLDNSKSMLAYARQRRRSLPLSKRSHFSIQCQDMRNLHLSQKFRAIVSVNNALEHLGDKKTILETLTRIRKHLLDRGIFFAEVHNPKFWQQRAGWKKCRWLYEADLQVHGTRFRLWERTSPGQTPNAVVWEHATSSDLMRFTLLRTTLWLFEKQEWEALFLSAGFRIRSLWENWAGTPASDTSSKLVFVLNTK
ncbi:MAG: methyltransferase domain-containing protein [Deltaproteobacteria bacterium]|nr:methyltransferase domain-containing protein [Deltaproteobacteria bacterium]